MLGKNPQAWKMIPGLIVMGIGLGICQPVLLNVIQGSVLVEKQSEISGVNRSVSNLGSSLGTAVAGAVLMSILVSTTFGLISTSPLIKKVFTPAQIQAFQLKLDKDAQTMGNTQARSYLNKELQKLEEEGQVLVPEASALENLMLNINQDARNKGMITALAVVGILGLLALVLSLFMPSGAFNPAAEPEDDDKKRTADKALRSQQGFLEPGGIVRNGCSGRGADVRAHRDHVEPRQRQRTGKAIRRDIVITLQDG
jgi:hypothetical protein